MSTRLHALGFPAEWTERVAHLVRGLAPDARKIETPKGYYRCWRSRDGAELWFHYPARSMGVLRSQTDPAASNGGVERPIDIITPFHRGQSSITIRLGRVLSQDRSNPLEGTCLAWLPKTETGRREQAIALELVPFARHQFQPPPFITKAQIVCCTHSVQAFASEAAYLATTPDNRRVPLGAYWPVNETDMPGVRISYRSPPVTLGLTCGTIRRSIRLNNPVTDSPYYWLALETRRGTFDVLANPAVVTGDISVGNIAQVYGSFIARLEGTPS